MTKSTLNVSGMHCTSCAVVIERTIKKIEGVNNVVVNYATKKASVDYDASKTKVEQFEEVIKSLGYSIINDELGVILNSLDTNISIKLEQVFKEVTGVVHVRFDIPNRKLMLIYDSSLISSTEILNLIHKAGYKAKIDFQDREKEVRDSEIQDLKTKVIVSLLFSLPFMAIMVIMLFNVQGLHWVENGVVQGILLLPIIYAGRSFYKVGFKSLITFNPNMDSLVAIGTGAAIVYSFLATILPSTFTGFYYETAAFLITFILIGRYLETLAKGRTSAAIKKLFDLQAKTALVLRNGKEVKISIAELKIGDIIIVKPGEKVPTDGIVIEGHSFVDESMVTGESIPIEKNKGDSVVGVTINKQGLLKIKATKIGKDTFLSQVIKLVEDAQSTKAPIQELVDKISLYFVPGVILIALSTFVFWLIISKSLVFALSIGIAVLVIACPCAMGLATPTAVMVGTGMGAVNGILIKNAAALQKVEKISTIVFDKTGTLTVGKPQVTDIIALGKYKEDDVLRWAATVEKGSEHPLGEAIVIKAEKEKISIGNAKKFHAITGKGVTAEFMRKEILLGNRKLMEDNSVDVRHIENAVRTFENQAKTVVYVALNKKLLGFICIADVVKHNAKEAIDALRKSGMQIVMITGDNIRTAQAIANQLGIDDVLAEVMPKDKAITIKNIQKTGRKVAMVGDGINDAPALAQADVGIALGSGTDVAIETGDIVLVKNNIGDVVNAIELSKYTMNKIRQNLFWAFFYNTVSLPIAAGVLYPFYGFLLSPVLAGGAMALSSISVVTNSLLMRRYKNRI